MSPHQIKGKWMQVKGEVRRQWGRLRADDKQQIDGTYEKVIGMLQERYGGTCVSLVRERYGEEKDELIRWAGRWQHRFRTEVTEERIRAQPIRSGRLGSSQA